MITDPWFYAVAIPSVILVGLSKGGFQGLSALALPLLALAMSPIRAAAIMLPILMVQDVVSVWAYRRTWDRRNLAILLPASCIGIGLGYMFAAQVTAAGISLVLGLISVIFGARRLIIERKAPAPPAPARLGPGIFWGTITGFTSMIANLGSPSFQVFVMPQRLERDVFVGTGVVLFAAINIIKVPPFIALGQFTRETLLTSFVLFPLAAASTWAGVLLVRRVAPDRFYKVIYALLIVVGLRLIWDGAVGTIG